MAMAVTPIPFIGKILPPKTQAELIKRQRLLDVLHRNFDRKVVAVSAPAGYGKTTIAASFAREVDLPLCWYTLDESDQQLDQFLTYLTHSIKRCFPKVGKRTLAALHNSMSISSQCNEIIGTLVSEVYENVTEYFIIVLDDVHAIEASAPVKAALDMFLTQAPDNCRIILLSRIPPSVASMSRMVINRQATRLTAKDLAFDDEEVSQLITAFGLESTPEVESMVRECEGWIAGMVLAILGGRAVTSPVLNNDPGGDQEWFNYVMSEVYEKLPVDTQDFLTRSSMLYELRPSHCNAVLGIDNADYILMSLADSLQLVSRLEGEDLYRYHNLFQGFLVNRLRKGEAEFLRLHRRAGLYFMEKGLCEASIHHLCKAMSFDEAAEAIQRAAVELYEAGQWTRLAGWIDKLPGANLDTRPVLLIHRTRAAVQMGEAGLAMQLSSQALDMLREGPDLLLAQTHVARATALRLQGFIDQCLLECDIAIDLIGSPSDRASRVTVAEAYQYRGTAYGQDGRFAEARTALEQALAFYQQDGDIYHIARVHGHLGIACRSLGDFGAAVAHYGQAQIGWQKLNNNSLLASTMNNLGNLYLKNGHLQLAEETISAAAAYAREAGATRVLSYILNSYGEVLAHLGQYQRALQYYQESLASAKAASEHRNIVEGTEGMALIYLALGQPKRSLLLIEEARSLAGTHSGPQITGHLLTSQGLIYHILGEHQQARELLEQSLRLLEDGSDNITLARCYFHLANVMWAKNVSGSDQLVKMVNKLLNSPGIEASLLSEARLCGPFVRHAANKKT
ncbi:MAG: tetratricopeptide repeat protein [Dehalococcoidia bacterium]|nr:tetratricopeptide repeat protein [Dehalococcoidia bacterium]